ncbi:paired box and transposase domain containing, partial [Brachionus plicatilis]
KELAQKVRIKLFYRNKNRISDALPCLSINAQFTYFLISLKWQIVGLLKDQIKTEREIAELVGVSKKCVNTTKRNFQATSRVHNFGNCGRPPKLCDRDVSYIFRLVRKKPTTSYRQIAADFNSKFEEHKISKETVRRVLAKKGIPLLTLSDRIKRYKWCKEKRNCTDKDWAKVIFSDESNFEVLNRKSRVFVKRFQNEKYYPKFCVPSVQKGGGSVGIWGCMSYEGVGCCSTYTRRINQYIIISIDISNKHFFSIIKR